MTWWTVPREWPGETVFVVGGGPSVLGQDIEQLRGRKVIVVNSSYETVPFADYLVTHDPQWWREHKDKLKNFAGRVVAPTEHSQKCPLRLFVRKRYPPGPSVDPASIAMKKTTFTAGINLAMHLGAARIVLLGADGKMGADGKSHHHKPHAWWKFRATRWLEHEDELRTFVDPLRRLGIEVLNASPGSAWTIWPVVSLDEALNERRKAA